MASLGNANVFLRPPARATPRKRSGNGEKKLGGPGPTYVRTVFKFKFFHFLYHIINFFSEVALHIRRGEKESLPGPFLRKRRESNPFPCPGPCRQSWRRCAHPARSCPHTQRPCAACACAQSTWPPAPSCPPWPCLRRARRKQGQGGQDGAGGQVLWAQAHAAQGLCVWGQERAGWAQRRQLWRQGPGHGKGLLSLLFLKNGPGNDSFSPLRM